jgi:phage gp37-like protein
MPNRIVEIEEALLARARQALGNTIRTFATAPADWDGEIAQQLLAGAPAVYVAFLGWQPKPGDYAEPLYTGQFAVYGVTADSNEDQRRRGDRVGIGAYDIAVALAPALNGFLLRDADGYGIGTAHASACSNLFTTQLWGMGGTCYGLAVDVPMLLPETSAADLAALFTAHTDWDIEPAAAPADLDRWVIEDHTAPGPDAEDHTTLEGATL